MATFGIIIATIFIIWLFFVIPQVMFSIVGFIAFISYGVYIYYEEEDKKEEKLDNSIVLSLSINKNRCINTDYPLLITVNNKSKKTVNKIRFQPIAKRKGYSNSLTEYGYINLTKIIEPGKHWAICNMMPKLKHSTSGNNLIWSYRWKDVTFQ